MYGTVVICTSQIGPKSSKVSIQHVRNIGPTWGQLRPARPQLRPNLDPLGSNFGPTWLQHWAHLGGISAQVELHLGSTQGTLPARYEIFKTHVFTSIFHFFWVSMMLQMSNVPHFMSPLGPTWCKAAAKTAPSCAMLDLTWAYMCIAWLQLGVPGPRAQLQLDQLAPTWAVHVGAN